MLNTLCALGGLCENETKLLIKAGFRAERTVRTVNAGGITRSVPACGRQAREVIVKGMKNIDNNDINVSPCISPCRDGFQTRLYMGKYRVETSRLRGWDYSSPGNYFITICTKNRECLFGEIENELNRIRKYIIDNPANWGNDDNNVTEVTQ